MNENIIKNAENVENTLKNNILVFLGTALIIFSVLTLLRNTYAGFVGTVFFTVLIIGVEWANRQSLKDRIFIKDVLKTVALILIVLILFQLSAVPVNAFRINATQYNEKIEWNIEGMKPYTIWYDDKLILENYPESIILTNTNPGEKHILTVTDSKNETRSLTVVANNYTYPIWIWFLLLLTVIFIIVSIKVPFMVFPATVLSGLLFLLITPDSSYLPILRLIPAALFIGSMGAIYIQGTESK